jgi:hypothetical protein
VKSQFRKLYEKARDPLFIVKLYNILKNKRRLQLLKTISKERCSVAKLQRKLKEKGFTHSRQTILKEYVGPLTTAALAEEHHNSYYATMFGARINEIMQNFQDVDEVLSPHSECYEEVALLQMLGSPKTREELKSVIPEKSVARILGRLRRTALISRNEERSYIFFFKTKRLANGPELSPTERRVYTNIPAIGISARKLAEKSGISLRRTYKYLRKLRGKKLVLVRKKPMSYKLTARGVKKAETLEAIRDLTGEYLVAAAGLVGNNEKGPLLSKCVNTTSTLLEDTR